MHPWIVIIAVAAIAVTWLAVRARATVPRNEQRRWADDEAIPRLAARNRHVLMLMLDGLSVEAFETALAAGLLPNIAGLLAGRPSLSMQAVSTFPSATAPSLPELLAGRYAALEDLPSPAAVHAFDRDQRRVVRYMTAPDAWRWPLPNLFHTASAAGLSAVTVFEGRWDGPESILTTFAVSRAAAREVIGAGATDSGDRGPIVEFIDRIRKRGCPHLALVVFNDIDMKGHFHGPTSPQCQQALANTDRLIGDVLAELRAQSTPDGTSVLERTTVLLFGDHGMVPSHQFVDLEPCFRARELSVYDASTPAHVLLRERLGQLWTRWPDAILVSGGSNITQVYLRNGDGAWSPRSPAAPHERQSHARPDVDDLARALVEIPGVGQVLRARSPQEVEIQASDGRVAWVIRQSAEHGDRFAYVIPEGAETDPFDYMTDPATAALVSRRGEKDRYAYHSADTWMVASLHSRYPAAVPLIPKAFHPQRFTGDLMVTSLPGWSFLRGQKGDHGNLERDAILTPLILNGPGVEQAQAPEVPRLVDIFPTVAVLLGAQRDDPALLRLDGRAIVGVCGPDSGDGTP